MPVFYLLHQFVGLLPRLIELAALALIAALIIHYRQEVLFAWRRFWYRFPVLGRAKQLSKQLTIVGEGENEWFLSERTLCGEFKAYLDRRISDPALYKLSRSYLRKVREIGRRPMTVWSWLLISILVFVESLGFSYVLAGYTLPGASEALQGPGALLLAMVLAIILVFVTHHAGREWHKCTLVNHARVMWKSDPAKQDNLSSRVATIEDDAEDDNAKPYLQLIARLEANVEYRPGVPWINIAMVVAIIFIASFAFYVRYETLQTNQTQCVLADPGAPPPSILSGSGLPDLVTGSDEVNRHNGQSQACNSFSRASVATYLLLAVLFVFIQIIGWILGFRSGFAGIESKHAWKRTHRFGNEKEYSNWLVNERRRIVGIAQGHLANLQSLIRKHAEAHTIDKDVLELSRTAGKRTFIRYVAEEEAEEEKQKDKSGGATPGAAKEPAEGARADGVSKSVGTGVEAGPA